MEGEGGGSSSLPWRSWGRLVPEPYFERGVSQSWASPETLHPGGCRVLCHSPLVHKKPPLAAAWLHWSSSGQRNPRSGEQRTLTSLSKPLSGSRRRLLCILLVLPSEDSVNGQAGDGCDHESWGCWKDVEEGVRQRRSGGTGCFMARLMLGEER